MRARADDLIEIAEVYKGCPVHADQPRSRIKTVVKPELDKILAESNIRRLADIARDWTWSPEARLTAAARAAAIWEIRAENREKRPEGVDLDVVRASVAGLQSRRWRHFAYYCSLLDNWGPHEPRAMPREVPLDQDDR